MTEEDYLNSPMPYIDETDKDAVTEEMKERKKTIGMQIKICDDGELWYDTGIKGELFGEEAETWVKALDESGYFTFMNYRFIKE